MVRLADAFIKAGANTISMSLWQVDDSSTSIFMDNLYRHAITDNMKYNKAMNKVKRAFINGEYGDKYTTPYYWAPFVIYGQN